MTIAEYRSKLDLLRSAVSARGDGGPGDRRSERGDGEGGPGARRDGDGGPAVRGDGEPTVRGEGGPPICGDADGRGPSDNLAL